MSEQELSLSFENSTSDEKKKSEPIQIEVREEDEDQELLEALGMDSSEDEEEKEQEQPVEKRKEKKQYTEEDQELLEALGMDSSEDEEEKEQEQQVEESESELEQVEEDEEDDFKKFHDKVRTDYIRDIHPDIIQTNNEDIQALSMVIRNKFGMIADELHKSIPILTKYERSKVLGLRSKQLNSGAEPFVQVPSGVLDGYLIAELELKEKKLPFIIIRPFPNGKKEYWKVSDLEFIDS